MIVVPWVLLMVGVATAVILCTCKKGKCVHESKPCIFYGEFNPHDHFFKPVIVKRGERHIPVISKVQQMTSLLNVFTLTKNAIAFLQ